ncbi:hypothetical protein [Kitasatospora phosalacinea]|uniref:hypothetical protein n=1 Tax=Kitasatospora phosalacinea TaxID=2065 RepID=UPI002555320E|nr:hypothetical protein [Kitasatospora phosalacinea]
MSDHAHEALEYIHRGRDVRRRTAGHGSAVPGPDRGPAVPRPGGQLRDLVDQRLDQQR